MLSRETKKLSSKKESLVEFVQCLRVIFAILISFLITIYLVPMISALAIKLGIMDMPDGRIKRHERPTPYLGGLAVYVGFLSSLALVFPFHNQILLFMVGSTLLLFMGLIDDLIVTKPYQKFIGQAIASLCFLKAGFILKETFFLQNTFNVPVSLFWMLAIINAFNLVDVMDGLATTIAIHATASFFIIAVILQQPELALLLGSFMGALIGFWIFNKPAAQIYLGDAGSLFIGGFLATIPFLMKWSTYSWHGYIAPLIILAIPLLEVTALILIRTYKGIPFYTGSPDHFCLYLRANGWSVWEILAYVSGISTILFAVSLAVVLNYISLLSVVALGILFLAGWVFAMTYKRKKAF
jgi:UDP-GlcNAc:undecaprenyl-phosphate GlcNAc-1-phosphate transferase